MKTTERQSRPVRGYHQTARADAAAETHRRITRVFVDFMREKWLDEITLDQVAHAADVSVQTVIRHFGGKSGLLEAAAETMSEDVRVRRTAPPGDVSACLRALVNDYEAIGDLVIRLLAQESRQPELEPLLNKGRAHHRQWIEDTFALRLDVLPPADRKQRVAALIVITDVYAWKLLRRDQGFSVAAATALMTDLAERTLDPA